MDRTLILNYHYIEGKNASEQVSIDPLYRLGIDDFRKQMEMIEELGLKVISLDDYLNSVLLKKPLNENSLLITFDDGYISDYKIAYPVLKSLNFPATFFITLNNIKTPERWDQIKEMLGDGYAFGSHTLSHRYLTGLGDEDIRRELLESKKMIEQMTDATVRYVSMPGGRYNRKILRIAIECGYTAILTSDIGLNNPRSGLQRLKRWSVKRNTSIREFEKMIRFDAATVSGNAASFRILRLLKKVIGDTRYTRMKEWITRDRLSNK